MVPMTPEAALNEMSMSNEVRKTELRVHFYTST